MSTLHRTAALPYGIKLSARLCQAPDASQGRTVVRSVVRKLHLQFASPPSSLHREQVLRCRSNGDSLQVATDKQRISIDLEPQAEGEYCMPGEVLLDNESDEKFTILRVEVKDYPGLLRVCAWVLNGLQLTVQNARYVMLKLSAYVSPATLQQYDIMLSGLQRKMASPTT